MVTREERDSAIDKIDQVYIGILRGWLEREKANLDAFIANPTEHINYNPYMVPDFDALRSRSVLLEQAAHLLSVIEGYKLGAGITRAQHDLCLDKIPPVLFERLLEWAVERQTQIIGATPDQLAPISEYHGLFQFDTSKHQGDITKISNAVDGLRVVIEFAKEQENPQ